MSQREATTERRLIEIIRRAARRAPAIRIGIGDDCAVLEPTAGSVLLATTDLLIEDVHFRRRWATPTDIGWKALAVNVSDIAAMGGRPRWGLIALACPETIAIDEAEAFYAGVQALATEHDVTVLGQACLEPARVSDRAESLDLGDRCRDVPCDAPSLGRGPAQQGQALLDLDRVLHEVGGEAMQSKAHVDVEAHPDARPAHRRAPDVSEPLIGVRSRRADAGEDRADLALEV